MDDVMLLDRALDGDAVQDQAVPEDVGRLVALARALTEEAAAAPVPQMRAAARTDLRMALLREVNARREAPPPLAERVRDRVGAVLERWAYSARVAGVGGVAAALLSGGGVAVATEAALPGDLFYGLKLTVEEVALGFADVGVPRGQALLDRAAERIGDAGRALQRDDGEAAGAVALRLADTAARDGAQEHFRAYLDGGDTAVLDALAVWVEQTSGRLDLLIGVRGEATDALADLRTSLDRIGQRVEVLATGACTTCDLGVHDDGDAEGDTARGTEADGTPPLPSGPVDLTFIPPADEPFRACPCVPASAPRPAGTPAGAAPAPAGGQPTAAPPTPDGAPDPDPTDPPTEPGGGGGGTDPLPVPDPGPITEPLPDPLQDAVEDALDELPDAGPAAEPPAADPTLLGSG
jgi:hypothetical protein